MDRPLRKSVDSRLPKYPLGIILAKLNGNLSQYQCYVIVEGHDDKSFYERFFDNSVCNIYWSQKEDGKDGGCAYLQEIVSHVLKVRRETRIIGIMDTDYRKFIRGYNMPANIYNTDHRDMEMTVLSTASVNGFLCNWCVRYSNAFIQITPIVRHIGCLRVINEIYNLGINFDIISKMSIVFDIKTHQIRQGWRQTINSLFFTQKTKKRLCMGGSKCYTILSHYKNIDLFDLAQGHDTLSMLGFILNDNDYSISKIWKEATSAYSLTDFKNTQLYQRIHEWEVRNNCVIVL